MAEPHTEHSRVPQSKFVDKFNIVDPQETDSIGSSEWKEYLNSKNLKRAWRPPTGSPYAKYMKTKLIDSINKFGQFIKPRYSKGEERSIIGLVNLLQSRILGNGTAIILDSGGPHSIAMGSLLAKHGYQPIVMFDNALVENDSVGSAQRLATLVYYAKERDTTSKPNPNSPPVFILDAHRNNSYTYKISDFPSAKELIRNGITKIVHLNEMDDDGWIKDKHQSISPHSDLKPIVEAYEKSGIKMFYTGVKPWPDRERWGDIEHLSHRQ